MRKIFALVATGALALTMSSCGRASTADAGKDSIAGGTKGTIGVAMPTKTSQRWIKDGDAMKAQLEAAGYKVNLQYANDDIPTQVTQVNDMVTKKNQVLVVASIDGTALAGALKQAKEAGIPVIAYDRLLRSTDAVDYYTTFDNLKVGELQAQSLVKGLEASGKPAPWNVELFAGSPDDNNATFFFNGAMKVLQPMIDSGKIKIPSGETNFKTVATLRWDAGVAKKRMENLLTKSYSNQDVQGVLAPYDGISRGIIAALKGNGYGSRRQEAAGDHRAGRRDRVGQVDPGRRAVLLGVQGHQQAGRDHGQHDQADRREEDRDGQRHHVLQQRRQERPHDAAAARGDRQVATSSRPCSTRSTTPMPRWADGVSTPVGG